MSTYPNSRTITCIILFTCLFLFFNSCKKYSKSSESEQFIEDPNVGDIYFIEKNSNEFSLLKVSQVESDDVHFNVNKYSINTRRYIDESRNSLKFKSTQSLNENEYWTDSIITYKKDKLIRDYNDNIIYEIKR